MREISLEELSKCNGTEGMPVYIAHRGKVFDASQSKLWKSGKHMNRHFSGSDLTEEIQAAPHGVEVFERIPQVGVLIAKSGERPIPKVLADLLDRHPLLRRHPHPMLVHFPIVLMILTPLFNILSLLTGSRSFEVTAYHTLGAGVLFTPLAILTGFFTWWLNYLAKPLRPVKIKILFSILLLAASLGAWIWRTQAPDILILPFGFSSILYLLLTFSLIPFVSIIGWFGGQLTFPIGKKG